MPVRRAVELTIKTRQPLDDHARERAQLFEGLTGVL